jgi:hypothetical protein
MTEEDEEFNRIEREAAMRKEAVAATIAKREWVGLTDDEIVRLKMAGRDLEFVSMTALRRFAKDIDNKLKEKNDL